MEGSIFTIVKYTDGFACVLLDVVHEQVTVISRGIESFPKASRGLERALLEGGNDWIADPVNPMDPPSENSTLEESHGTTDAKVNAVDSEET